jgi:hypothetical protein
MATTYRTTVRGQTDYEVDPRFGEGRGKPLAAASPRPVVVEILDGDLCLVVGVVWLMMMMMNAYNVQNDMRTRGFL